MALVRAVDRGLMMMSIETISYWLVANSTTKSTLVAEYDHIEFDNTCGYK